MLIPNQGCKGSAYYKRASAHIQMSMTGTILFGVGGVGILTGFFSAGMWSLDQLRATDNRANSMISPSMPPMPPQMPSPNPPPPSPPPLAPAARRRVLTERVNEPSVFKFTPKEEAKILGRNSVINTHKKL